MSTHNTPFRGEIRKISILLNEKKHLIKSYGAYNTTNGTKYYKSPAVNSN